MAVVAVCALSAGQMVYSANWIGTLGNLPTDERAESRLLAANDDAVIAGSASEHGLIARIASNGAIKWQKAYGGTAYGHFHAIDASPSGGYFVAGFVQRTRTDVYDSWCAKVRRKGALVWQKDLMGNAHVYKHTANAVRQTAGGDLFTGGETTALGRHSDAFLMRLTAAGEYTGECDRVRPDEATYGGLAGTAADAAVTVTDTSATGSSWRARPRSAGLESRRLCE